jgi:hypothetical protein
VTVNNDRMTLNVAPQCRKDLDLLMAELGLNQTDVIHRATRLLAIYQETVRDGGEFLRRRTSGKEPEVILFL